MFVCFFVSLFLCFFLSCRCGVCCRKQRVRLGSVCRRMPIGDVEKLLQRGEEPVLLRPRRQRENELALLLRVLARPHEHAVRPLRRAVQRRVLRLRVPPHRYAEHRIVHQNLLAALRRPLLVGILPDAVLIDHHHHVHPLLEQTALAILHIEGLFRDFWRLAFGARCAVRCSHSVVHFQLIQSGCTAGRKPLILLLTAGRWRIRAVATSSCAAQTSAFFGFGVEGRA